MTVTEFIKTRGPPGGELVIKHKVTGYRVLRMVLLLKRLFKASVRGVPVLLKRLSVTILRLPFVSMMFCLLFFKEFHNLRIIVN